MNEKDIYLKIEEWLINDKEVAIANVIETWGSSPRPVGSIMAISNKNEIIGSVSGGCVENFVYSKGLEVIEKNKTQILDFGVTNSQAWEVGLTCGGKIKILLEKITKSDINYIKKINYAFLKGIDLIIATKLANGEKLILDDNIKNSKNIFFKYLDDIKKEGSSSVKMISNEKWFLKLFKNNIKLVIVGAVHIAEPLIEYANSLNFQVYLIDPRSNYDDNKYDKVSIYKEWPDDALKKIIINKDTAVVTLTHDPKLDDPAIQYTLKSNAFYLGCLGSQKTQNSRIKRLNKKGFTKKSLEFINGPIGLSIGAKTPSEIAISIISQIIKKKNTINA